MNKRNLMRTIERNGCLSRCVHRRKDLEIFDDPDPVGGEPRNAPRTKSNAATDRTYVTN